jgi:hypothetical protein
MNPSSTGLARFVSRRMLVSPPESARPARLIARDWSTTSLGFTHQVLGVVNDSRCSVDSGLQPHNSQVVTARLESFMRIGMGIAARRAASRAPVRQQPHDGRSLAGRRHRDRARARAHAHAPHGHRGDLPPPEDVAEAPRARGVPYLLRKLAITRPNHVWAADITYIPMTTASSTSC